MIQDGKIEAEVKLTGILSLGALLPGEFRKYGTMIAPGLYAPVHQHFFVARMDMAVDSKPGDTLNQVTSLEIQNFLVILCMVMRFQYILLPLLSLSITMSILIVIMVLEASFLAYHPKSYPSRILHYIFIPSLKQESA